MCELLNEPVIAQFIATHQGATAESVRRAAEYLKNQNSPDALDALKKILPALDERSVKVFFSYKKKDEDAAKNIIEQLKIHSAEKLQICSMADYGVQIVGQSWRNAIRKDISSANWFMLLLPDPTDDWDWCMYETGLFEAHRTSSDRLICIYHPDSRLPSQLEGYQAVRATIPEMEDFLKGLFMGDDQVPGFKALNRAIEPDISSLAKEIVDTIRPPRKNVIRQTFPAWVELSINKNDLTDDFALDQAAVVDCNDEALQLFHFLQRPKSFEILRSKVLETDSRWRIELSKAIKAIGEGEMFEPVQAVFKSRNGKIYRPVACAVDRIGDTEGPIERYHVAFVEEVGALDSSSFPKQMTVLSSVLRFSFRFRWEVLEPFSSGTMSESDVMKLENTLLRMRADWFSRGMTDFSAVLQCFSDDKAKRIGEIMRQWQKARNAEGTGAIDVAIQNKDVAAIPGLLRDFLPLSQEFLELAADRFSEMIAGK